MRAVFLGPPMSVWTWSCQLRCLGMASFGLVDGAEVVLSSCSISILLEREELWRFASRADIALQFVCFQIVARQ